MRKFLFCLGLFFCQTSAMGQYDFLAYSVKGKVSYTLNGAELMLKIGKVLKDQAIVRVAKGSMVTFICDGTRAITFDREGAYSLDRYKDSGRVERENLLSSYFRYIWDQLYVQSSNKSRMWNKVGPARGNNTSKKEKIFERNPALDTVRYASGNFSLHWYANYDGPFVFRLSRDSDGKQLLSKKIRGTSISLDKLTETMKRGQNYSWTANPDAEETEPQVIEYISKAEVSNYIDSVGSIEGIVENTAERYFRIAFFLEGDRYFADAYSYYRKAAAADPGNSLYSEVVKQFEREYSVKK